MAAIQWYPGHMSKTNRLLADSLKLTDIAIEVIDARIPQSSRNPDLDRMLGGRRRLIAFNKEDLADPQISAEWKAFFSAAGSRVVFANAKSGAGLNSIRRALKQIGLEKVSARAAAGVVSRPVRAMVAGIPNSGKSTLINMLAGKPVAKTADRPGVTRAKQWVKLDGGIELLDTPGVLWPKFESEETAYNLAFTGAIKDDIVDTVDIAEKLLALLQARYPAQLEQRYGAACVAEMGEPAAERTRLEAVGARRGFLLRGGEIDLARTATIVLDEFRAGKIGRITLERPPEKPPSKDPSERPLERPSKGLPKGPSEGLSEGPPESPSEGLSERSLESPSEGLS